MADEVGQYVGGDTDLLINLQSFVEKIGSECNGKVWVICTGQEAIDEIIKARENEFSRIQARFKTRLSLSSSSADEVIQKRILLKTTEAKTVLENIYALNDSVLRNLFSFTDTVLDIRGYADADEFSKNFPFVPYQFILMQKVFAEIRKHGNSGKHLSGGERSMLSGFQEAAQKIEYKNEYALAPFYLFYDTVHKFLDSGIRRVIERCERAAMDGNGIEPQDVDALKLLYLLRYVNDDVQATLDNLVILMADDIRLDKISMREQVQASLDRLLSQNYIGRAGNAYNFLTDEEQDIQREIKNTTVATADIVKKIAHMIFSDIYTTKKFRYGKYDFAFDQMVDGQIFGSFTGGMTLRILTMATDATEKQELRLMAESAGQAIVALAETPYYETLENAMKISKYVAGRRNMTQLPKSVQDIIRGQQDQAGNYESAAMENLQKAITEARFYVDGEHLEFKSGDAKSKINQALEYLVTHVYSEIGLITQFAETDADIYAILRGDQQSIPGAGVPNQEAAIKIERYLEIQFNQKLPTTMFDVQERFRKKPYGWREIDIAAVVATLIYDQKVTVKYGGATIQPNNPRLPDMLRKKSEIGKTSISKRQAVSIQMIREVREFLRDFFDEMDVPEDEDGLIAHIIEKFDDKLNDYATLDTRYENHKYPDRDRIRRAIALIKDILSRQKDNTALIQRVIEKEDELDDMRDSLQDIEEFFKNRVTLFDNAVRYAQNLRVDIDYIAEDKDASRALEQIRLITTPPVGARFPYERIPELNGLMAQVKASHDKMLTEKREALLDIVRQCMGAIHTAAGEYLTTKNISKSADDYFTGKKQEIESCQFLALLDGMTTKMWAYKDNAVDRITAVLNPNPKPVPPPVSAPNREVIKSVFRQGLFQAKTLKSEAEIDDYLNDARDKMKRILKGCDGITLK